MESTTSGNRDDEHPSVEELEAVIEGLEHRVHDLEHEVGTLSAGLDSSREIGAAVGVVMERLHLTSGDAFELIVKASQNLNVKVHEVAERIVATGDIGGATSARADRRDRGQVT